MRRLGEAALVKSLCRPGSLLFRLACDLEAAEVLLRVLKSCCHKSCAHQRCDTSCNPTPPKYIYIYICGRARHSTLNFVKGTRESCIWQPRAGILAVLSGSHQSLSWLMVRFRSWRRACGRDARAGETASSIPGLQGPAPRCLGHSWPLEASALWSLREASRSSWEELA